MRTTVFSSVTYGTTVTVNGTDYTDFTGLVIEEKMSKAGLSGIVSTEMTVTLQLPPETSFTAPDNAEVIVNIPGLINNPPPFYISKRKISGRQVTLNCRSKIYQLDRPSDFTDSDFDENGMMDFDDALAKIANSAGFISTALPCPVPETLRNLPKSFLKSANCMSILEKLSAALIGTFREYGGVIVFTPWAEPFMEIVPAEPLEPVNYGYEKQITHLVMSDNRNTNTFEQGSGGYAHTLRIETPFASAGLASAVYGRVCEHVYKPFECKAMRINSIPAIGCTLSLHRNTEDETELFCNNIRIYVKKSGLYAKAACNDVYEDEWDYTGELERAVLEKIAADERIGSLTIEKTGVIKLENTAHIEDPSVGHSATITADTDYGVTVETDKAQIKADTLDLSNTPEILLKPAGLLTESKDLIGALNELFTAETEGGDTAPLPTQAELLAADDFYADFLNFLAILPNGGKGNAFFYKSTDPAIKFTSAYSIGYVEVINASSQIISADVSTAWQIYTGNTGGAMTLAVSGTDVTAINNVYPYMSNMVRTASESVSQPLAPCDYFGVFAQTTITSPGAVVAHVLPFNNQIFGRRAVFAQQAGVSGGVTMSVMDVSGQQTNAHRVGLSNIIIWANPNGSKRSMSFSGDQIQYQMDKFAGKDVW
jgi:hypothetical protein